MPRSCQLVSYNPTSPWGFNLSNTAEHATLAVLDGQFYLHTLVDESSDHRVFHATHLSGEDFAVKIIPDASDFFDVLARLYAVDHSPYFSKCICNYPPGSIAGKPLPLSGELAELVPGADPEQTGILVLEWVEGIPLLDTFEDADEMEKVNGLLELTLALKDLHKNQICHGNLKPENVLMEEDSGEVRLIGLSKDPDWWMEGDEALLRKGMATDVKDLALHFLNAPKDPGRAFKQFRSACTHSDELKRPCLNTAQKHIKLLRQRHTPRKSLEIMFGFLKPLHVLTWLVFVWGASMAINRLMGDGTVPLARQRVDIISDKKMSAHERVTALREVYALSSDDDFRARLAKDISECTRPFITERDAQLSDIDAAWPIAVLAFRDKPAVIARERLIRIGDWVGVDQRFGFVEDIQYSRIKIVYENAHSWHFFERPDDFQGLTFGTEVAIVWRNENNLDRLLEGMAHLFDMEYIRLAPEGDEALPAFTGHVSGVFPAAGGFSTFIKELNHAIDVRVENNMLVFRPSRTRLPVYWRAFFLNLEGRDLASIAGSLSAKLGVTVKIEDELGREKTDKTLYNISWQELVKVLGLKYRIESKKDQILLVLEKHESEKSHTSTGESR